MKDITSKLAVLKSKITTKEKEDDRFRTQFKQTISDLFPRHKNPMDYIRDFYVRDNKLIIQTKNKAFAQELFLRRNYLQEKLTTITIKHIIIR